MTLNDMFFGLLRGSGDVFRTIGIIVVAIIFVMVLCCGSSLENWICIGVGGITGVLLAAWDVHRKKKKSENPWK